MKTNFSSVMEDYGFAECFCLCVRLHIPLTAESLRHSMLVCCPQILCSCSFPTCTALLWLFISSVTAVLQSQHRFTTTHLCFCWLWAHRLLATNPKQISHIFSIKMLSTLLNAALSNSACDFFPLVCTVVVWNQSSRRAVFSQKVDLLNFMLKFCGSVYSQVSSVNTVIVQ